MPSEWWPPPRSPRRVEFVEALTIVLAMGLDPRLALDARPASAPRSRRSPSSPRVAGYALRPVAARGAAAARRRHAAADLRAAVAAQGDPARVGPEGAARRGRRPSATEVEAARARRRRAPARPRLVRLRRVSFKGVFLEGLEIVFIVITFGLNANSIPLATARRRDRRGDRPGGRLRAAQAARARAGEHDQVRRRPAAHAPSARSGPSRGSARSRPTTRASSWPGGDAALLVLLAAWCALAWATVRLLAPRGAREVA